MRPTGSPPIAHSTRPAWAILLSFPLAGLVAAASLGGLLLPTTYANEAPIWALEGVAQDWIDLVIVCPLLILSAIRSLRGSSEATHVLTGGILFVTYSFMIYAFDVHFNSLFLVYCATLGLAGFLLIGMTGRALSGTPFSCVEEWPNRRMTIFTGWFLLFIAVLFAALWLSEILPAIIRGVAPAKITESGLLTNPVHVIDLSFFLPAQAIVAVALLTRRPLGLKLAPTFLVFGTVMSITIGANRVFAIASGLSGNMAVVSFFGALAAAYLVLLVLFFRGYAAAPLAPSPARGRGLG